MFDVRDTANRGGTPLVAKAALLPLHRPFDLDPEDVRRRRYALRVEGHPAARLEQVEQDSE